jgi:outer membrane protein assembly factor BamB
MKNTATVVAMVLTLSATPLVGEDWPGLYGPRRNHTSEQKRLLRTWPEEGPKVLWALPLNAGFGGPAVSDGKVYLLDRDESVGDKLRV